MGSWTDSSLPLAERVEALLSEMTLEEKVAQLGSVWVGAQLGSGNVAPMQEVFADPPSLEQAVHGLGHLTRRSARKPVEPVEGARKLAALQQDLVARTRLGIPALVHEECLTGFTTFGATVYPAAIAWGATFDPDLVERMAPRSGGTWPRSACTRDSRRCSTSCATTAGAGSRRRMGEDPYLVAMLGTAYVRGLQSAGVIATLKHFAGYSASRAARNHGPVSMGRARAAATSSCRRSRWRSRAGGAGSVMNSYSDVDGVPGRRGPLAAHRRAARRVGIRRHGGLRLLGGAVPRDHAPGGRGRPTRRARWRCGAGIDVELPDTLGYGAAARRAGARTATVPEALVDRAARRLLRQKVELGLLDPDWTPEGSVAGAAHVDLDSAGQPRPRPRDGRARRSSCSTPDGALPLGAGAASGSRVVGPCADDPRTFMGCYAFPNHVLPRHPGSRARHRGADRGRRAARRAARRRRRARAGLPDAGRRPVRLRGRGRRGPRGRPVRRLRRRPRRACSGTARPARAATPRTSAAGRAGRAARRAARRPGPRWSWWSSPAARTRWATCTAGAAGLVQAFMPGEEGGAAIAGVLSGRVQPQRQAARADPTQRRRRSPARTCSRRSARDSAGISSLDPTPLFPFGHGGSYTTSRCDDLHGQRDRGADRRRVHRLGAGAQHRARAPATRWSSSTCATSSPR